MSLFLLTIFNPDYKSCFPAFSYIAHNKCYCVLIYNIVSLVLSSFQECCILFRWAGDLSGALLPCQGLVLGFAGLGLEQPLLCGM